MIRNYVDGLGTAVAERTFARKKEDGTFETWEEVAYRVAIGNISLCDCSKDERTKLIDHMKNATVLMSGRHLQHGDLSQKKRPMEVFTNCATAPTSYLSFLNLLSGSGVGRCYDDDLMLVNWDNAPTLRCVLSNEHPDFDPSAHESVRDAQHKYGQGKQVMWYEVPDSREGWAKALELWENAAFEKIHKDKMLILDFSKIRAKDTPIGGMQNRPASGPVALMNAFHKASTLKGANLDLWMQAMYIDHCYSVCVLVGGARRAARMSTKHWKDDSIFKFIDCKRPIEFENKTPEEILEIRKTNPVFGFLWTSNNSIAVDDEFWSLLEIKKGTSKYMKPITVHARKVFRKSTEAAYYHGLGEPGFLNIHKLTQNDDDMYDVSMGDYVGSDKYIINEDTKLYMAKLAKRILKKKHYMSVNPCCEISLSFCGFCVLADVVPYHADTIDEAEDAFRTATRALMRVNTMESIYNKEVKRTNRIGVGMTGVQEFAWKFFGYGFRDLLDESKSQDFWDTMQRFNHAVRDESIKYAKELGVNVPHTSTTCKPAGTTSKIFGLTEGWHLPARQFYLRWVQFRFDDPLVNKYAEQGYPIKHLKTYEGTVIVGFPTAPEIAKLGLGDKLLLASEATPEEQYQWLRLGEKYYIDGQSEEQYGNQISYTLKYKPSKVSYKDFKDMILKNQPTVKCCAVMQDDDISSYEYLPEERISKEDYDRLVAQIDGKLSEDIGIEHISCSGGNCGIDFNETKGEVQLPGVV